MCIAEIVGRFLADALGNRVVLGVAVTLATGRTATVGPKDEVAEFVEGVALEEGSPAKRCQAAPPATTNIAASVARTGTSRRSVGRLCLGDSAGRPTSNE
jgi:hypothetical protein